MVLRCTRDTSLRDAARAAGEIRYEFPRVSPSGTGRVCPDTTRVSPPTLGAGLRTDPRLHRRAVRMPPSLAARATAGVRVHHIFTFQTARRTSLTAPGEAAPGRRRLVRLEKSRTVKRRKALARKPPHPVARLAIGPVPSRKGPPAHVAGRRALRRSTTGCSRGLASLASGRASSPVTSRSPVAQQCSLLTGPSARMAGPRRPEFRL